MKFCSVNGIKQNHILVNDRGLAFGDGSFTTAKVVKGQVVYLDEHIKRLIVTCQKLAIKPPAEYDLINQIKKAARGNDLAVLKVIITAGVGGRGYSRKDLNDNATSIVVIISEFPSHYQQLAVQGVTLGDSQQLLSVSPMLAGLKHLNRLEQVLIKSELEQRSEDELVIANYLGQVIETSSANIFYFIDDKLHTPDLSLSGVDGIMRQLLLRHEPQAIISPTSFSDLSKANSIFICNSLLGIIPVRTYNNRLLDLTPVFTIQAKMNTICLMQ
jgi:4-amino-4-deoxychorismate lyase